MKKYIVFSALLVICASMHAADNRLPLPDWAGFQPSNPESELQALIARKPTECAYHDDILRNLKDNQPIGVRLLLKESLKQVRSQLGIPGPVEGARYLLQANREIEEKKDEADENRASLNVQESNMDLD